MDSLRVKANSGPHSSSVCSRSIQGARSGVLLSGAILIWTYLTILWIGRHRLFIYAAVGAYWLALTRYVIDAEAARELYEARE